MCSYVVVKRVFQRIISLENIHDKLDYKELLRTQIMWMIKVFTFGKKTCM